MKKLSPVDYGFILAETPETPMHITAVQIFEIPKDYHGNFVKTLVEEMLEQRDVGPPFNYLLRPALLGLPSWEELDEVDLEYHVRHSALPNPGSMHDLWQLISRLTSRLLDRSRPLWEVHLIEGLSNGRFAMYVKVHHAFMDGATGVRLFRAALSDDPDEKTASVFWKTAETKKPARSRRKPASPLAMAVKLVQSQFQTLPDLAGYALRRVGQQTGLTPGHLAVPFTAPRTPFNTTVRQARRNAGVSLSLSSMKTTGRAVGASINEVLLTCVDMAFNRYLSERAALPDKPMVAATPIDLRAKSGSGSKGSNVVAILLVNLGEPDADPLSRLRQIHLSSDAAKEEAQGMSSQGLIVASMLPFVGATVVEKLGLSQQVPPLINILVSNVKGLDQPYYLKGASLLNTYTAPPLGPGMAMTIITGSYVDSMDIGISSDRDAVPELEQLAGYIGEAFKELEAAAKGTLEA
jgi:WS/DGAT/MGAT family acyltransferase